MIDRAANIEHWNQVRDNMQYYYEDFKTLSIEDEIKKFASLETRGMMYLEFVLNFKILMDEDRAAFVSARTSEILNLAIKLKKYNFMHLGSRGYGQVIDEQIEEFELGGETRCLFFLRLLNIIDGNVESANNDGISKALQSWEAFGQGSKGATRNFLDKHSCLWLSYDAHQTYVSLCEGIPIIGFSPKSKIDRKNKRGVAYKICRAIVDSDREALCNWLEPRYEQSKKWYESSEEYPWWDRLVWCYTYHRHDLGNTDTAIMWQDLKGY
jgi:hypothetical protein